MGSFFKRLETYTELTPTAAMTDIITEIMVEVLTIFGIATKELRRGSASEFRIGCLRISTELGVEKFLKRLAGRTDLEDALKKLDRLTQEEARMAVAENLRITHSVRNEVKVVDGKVEDIGDKVRCVDEKVQVVIEGARGMSCRAPIPPNIFTLDGKQATVAANEAKLILQQAANTVDEIKCS